MELQLFPADFERAREIIAARASVIGVTGELADRVSLAVAIGIAEVRAQGIKESIKRVTGSDDR
jgi:hypothetical protein